MFHKGLSFNTRKALAVHIGEAATSEVVSLLESMALRIAELERNKVSITRIVPAEINLLERETFEAA